MAEKPQKLKAAEIIFDESFYVRWSLDRENVRRLRLALQAGAKLPPIAVQKSTMRLIYGAHRLHAHIEEYGDDAEIEVLVKDVDDAEAVRLALKENAHHGLPFRPIDLRRATIIAERFKLSDEEIIRCLSIPPGRLMDLRAQRGKTTRHGKDSNGQEIPLKGSMLAFSGQVLTPAQVDATRYAPGMSLAGMASQLAKMLEARAYVQTLALHNNLLRLREAIDAVGLDTWEVGDVDTVPAQCEQVPA